MHLKPINNYYNLLFIGGFLYCIMLSACRNDSTSTSSSNEMLEMPNTLEEQNKALVYQWIEARNTNDLETAQKIWRDDNKEGLTKAFNGITQAFPNVQIITDDIFIDGNKVALRWTFKGTHKGTYQNIEATGREVTWEGIDIYTIIDGKIASLDRASDWSVLMVQLSDDFQPQSMPYYQQFSKDAKE